MDVARRVGITYRQLVHWCDRGWIPGQPPSGVTGSGMIRHWTPEQIDCARLLAEAARIRAMPMPELAMWLAQMEGARRQTAVG